jgi:hypothetical protein
MTNSKFYLEMILSAVQWGLSEQCPAWKRTVDYVNNNKDLYDIFGINEAMSELKGEASKYLESWFIERVEDEDCEGFNTIKSMSPEDLWIELVFNNSQPFGGAKDPLKEFLIAVPAKVRHTAPLWLKPNIDGWGINPA